MAEFLVAFVAAAIIGGGATWLFCNSLIKLLKYHSRRLSAGALYLQWRRGA